MRRLLQRATRGITIQSVLRIQKAFGMDLNAHAVADDHYQRFAFSPIAPFAAGGMSLSGLFELRKRVQYLFQVTGACMGPPGTKISTLLYNRNTQKTIVVSEADIGLPQQAQFPIMASASLLLEPAIYTWASRILPIDDTGVSVSLRGVVANSPEKIDTRGRYQASSVMSGPAGRSVNAIGLVDVTLGASQSARATVSVTNLQTGAVLATGVTESQGPFEGAMQPAVAPYLLAAGVTYRAQIRVTASAGAQVRCLLRQE